LLFVLLIIEGFVISATLALRIKRDAVNLLYGSTGSGLIVSFITSFVFVFGFQNNPMMQLKFIWLLCISLVLILRMADTFYWFKKLKNQNYDPMFADIRFTIGAYLTAIIMGIYPVIFFASMELIELATTFIILSVFASAVTNLAAASRKIAIGYAAIILVPMFIRCLISSEESHRLLGELGILFTLVIIFSAFKSSRFTSDAILVKNEHANLLKEMELKSQEITEINANLEEKVKHRTAEILAISKVDPLTRLFNRNAFSKSLQSLIAKAEADNTKLALLFIDLDGFKGVNDSHGHAVGDRVLTATSHRLYIQAQKHEYLCRWGGDEFLIVLQNRDEPEAKEFAKRLILLLSQPIRIDMNFLNVGATIGIAMYPEHSTSEHELIELADTAMYAQKQVAKSDVCVFNDKMRDTLFREKRLKDGLGRALDNKQLFVVYQPVVDSRTGDVVFCEALLRWDLDGELIPPDEFIPIAEQNGFIHGIGSWVLQQACKDANQWGFDKTVDLSVNVSVSQLMHNDMVETVKTALQNSGFPAKNLHLEITESIFVEDTQLALRQIKALQQLKIKVSVDDFGTGFSSLALLQSFSADVVKIDKNFVATMNEGGKAIIQATQYMAKELGYSVVVEGVETKMQADLLTAMGIESLQGFYFSIPMRQEKLMAWHQGYLQLHPAKPSKV
jgi:diguanylate cyclase (GGDEF)-like protein